MNHRIARAAAPLLSLALLILGGVFLSPIVAAAGLSLAVVYPTIGTVVHGTQQLQDQPTDHRVPSVSEILTRIEPQNTPFVQLLTRIGATEKVTQVKHTFGEIGRLPRYVRVNDSGGTDAGGAGVAHTITIDSRNAVAVGDLLIEPSNATDPTGTYQVVAINSATSIDIIKIADDSTGNMDGNITLGTVPAFADDAYLFWIGNAKSEADAASAAKAQKPSYLWNYVQTLDHRIQISDHAMRSENYGPQDWQRTIEEQLAEFNKSREYNWLFNETVSVYDRVNLAGNTEKHWVGKGLYGFITATATIPSAPTASEVTAFMYDVMLRGSNRKVLMGGSVFMENMDTAPANNTLQTSYQDHEVGLYVTDLIMRGGRRLTTIHHPGFDEMGREDEALVLDMEKISRGVYADVEVRPLELKNSSTGIDAEGQYITTKETLIVRGAGDGSGNNATHYRVTISG